ncbi:MAG: acyl carrier protein [Bacteroidetes bacterium]|nr:acyl carrier protein [Bacteroidota bacterium]
MSLQTFVTQFADGFNQTDPATINPHTEFRKLEEWGSMMALITIAMVDSEYGKTLTAEDIKGVNTVEELYNLINSK